MLTELVISNFAIIGRLELSLGPGLSCMTGETGAGKSIFVDALSFIMGGRPVAGITGDGGDTSVEAMFDVSALPEVRARLEELGLGADDGLVLRRVTSASGRGRAYVNGALANVGTLQSLGEWLVDIHGQHEHQSLLKVDRHIELLDEYCSVSDEMELYAGLYARVSELGKRLHELRGMERERAQRLDLLRFQISEIDAAGPQPGEDEMLSSERARLAHADRLKELARGALDAVRDNDDCALSLLSSARKAAGDIAEVVPEMAEALRLIESAAISAGEACSLLRDFEGSLEADPERLDMVEGRLDLISGLKKKYGDTIDDVLEYRDSSRDEAGSLEHSADEMAGLEDKIAEARRELMESGRRLSSTRTKGAGGFSERVQAELAGMGMPKAVFEVKLEDLAEPGPRGLERAEFLFSANPGRRPMPLAKIASGGELSRVMLALKVVLARKDTVPTLVFDEVDSGIGGVTAGTVGKKLRQAADGRQVLCITHLPQIASLASEHFTVTKKSGKKTTEVYVKSLDKDERVAELARMLGGDTGSRTASAHAQELVRQGEDDG